MLHIHALYVYIWRSGVPCSCVTSNNNAWPPDESTRSSFQHFSFLPGPRRSVIDVKSYRYDHSFHTSTPYILLFLFLSPASHSRHTKQQSFSYRTPWQINLFIRTSQIITAHDLLLFKYVVKQAWKAEVKLTFTEKGLGGLGRYPKGTNRYYSQGETESASKRWIT